MACPDLGVGRNPPKTYRLCSSLAAVTQALASVEKNPGWLDR